MPTYVYRFVDTGETIEVQQSFSDDALTEAAHPKSGVVMPVKKVFTPVGVSFKGGGFYKTDSRSSSGRSAKGSSEGGSSESSSTSDTSSSTSPSSPSKDTSSSSKETSSSSKDTSSSSSSTSSES